MTTLHRSHAPYARPADLPESWYFEEESRPRRRTSPWLAIVLTVVAACSALLGYAYGSKHRAIAAVEGTFQSGN